MRNIRAKAVCLFRHDDRVLLAQAFDPKKNEHYLMPIGGGVEFGERAVEAIQREVMEEIQQQICNVQLHQIFENIFTFDGQQGHEIVFVYSADFVSQAVYNMSELCGVESNGACYTAAWYSQTQLDILNDPIYPDGISLLLFPLIEGT
ncbi:hypothetical protein B9T25_08360 [Acinetobacter sp. ANC 4470]|uniref:NUDIX hydrolase n=1 Tax=Acinetobacter sp. ANC 4470 TaxID=1977881 RepID=UPI000A354AB6|nr:NUDIX domain-containing protein [Acinetobacter sp. ANC 4470]OTG67978.1 hypothetical protein B9T25_08360 [Acinetobacter sp. ANC 4470]